MVNVERRNGMHTDAFGMIVSRVVESDSFKSDLLGNDRKKALHFLEPQMRSLTFGENRDLGILLISGLSMGTQLWDVTTQRTALEVFSRINFRKMDDKALDSVKNSYTHAIKRQKRSTDPNDSANMLLQVGETLIPYLSSTGTPSTAIELKQAWNFATANKGEAWQKVSKRALAQSTVLGLMYIELLSSAVVEDTATSAFTIFERDPSIDLEQLEDEIKSRESAKPNGNGKTRTRQPSPRREHILQRYRELESETRVGDELGITPQGVSYHLHVLASQGHDIDFVARASKQAVIKNRQLVFLLYQQRATEKEIVHATGLTPASVIYIKSWLREQQLIGLQNVNRIPDPKLYHQFLEMYYQGFSIKEMHEMTGLDAQVYINELRNGEEKIIGRKPNKSDVRYVRAYSKKGYTAHRLSLMIQLPVQTIEGILSLPDELFQTTVFERSKKKSKT